MDLDRLQKELLVSIVAFAFVSAYCPTEAFNSTRSVAHATVSSNVLARDYSIHPILHTKPGQHFNGKLRKAELEKLCHNGFSFRGVPFDVNYMPHLQAEKDAAAIICKLALKGQLEEYWPKPESIGAKDISLTVGFNQIPLLLSFEDTRCVKAIWGKEVEPTYRKSYISANPPLPSALKHAILGTAEFAPLGDIRVSDQQFKEMNDDPGAASYYENSYLHNSSCFQLADWQSALQFRERVLGLSDTELLRLFGEPSIKTGAVLVWGDSDRFKKNWIYYLGYSGVPIRLVFDGERCIGSAILSHESEENLASWNRLRYSSARNSEKEAARIHKIAGFEFKMGNPEGKSEEELLKLFGEPQAITKDYAGHPVWEYGVSRFSRVEIPIVDGKAYGYISILIRVGWKQRKAE